MDIVSKFFILVSEISENVDLVMGMKNIFKLEGVFDLQDSCFSFSQEINPIFSIDDGRDCTKDTRDGYSRGPLHRRAIRNGHG